jgi:hypothetical protein
MAFNLKVPQEASVPNVVDSLTEIRRRNQQRFPKPVELRYRLEPSFFISRRKVQRVLKLLHLTLGRRLFVSKLALDRTPDIVLSGAPSCGRNSDDKASN